jgi:hypothetical protein
VLGDVILLFSLARMSAKKLRALSACALVSACQAFARENGSLLVVRVNIWLFKARGETSMQLAEDAISA